MFSDRHCSFESFQPRFFLGPSVISSQACHIVDVSFAEYVRRPSVDLCTSLCVTLSGTLSYELQPDSISVTTTQGVHRALPVFVLPAPRPGHSLKTMSLESQRAHVSSCLPGITVLHCLILSVFKITIVLYILFILGRWRGSRPGKIILGQK